MHLVTSGLRFEMIYVDPLVSYPNKRKQYCHMATDGNLVELHVFSILVGLKRHWFQGGRLPHYDLTESKREIAVNLGAVESDHKTLYLKCYGNPPGQENDG